MKYVYFDNLAAKYKFYGPKLFVRFSLIEIYRIFLRIFLYSFSQFREDIIIEKYLGKGKSVSYIDIGGNHPIKFNNTYRFYLKGGHGVNIEPISRMISLYKKLRPKDINLDVGVSNVKTVLTFYELFPDTSSTFSPTQAKKEIKAGKKLVNKKKIKLITLKEIFKKYLKTNYADVMSIDAEGFDLKVLKGNDWRLNRIKVICIESHDPKIYNYLIKTGYQLVYRNVINAIYVDNSI